MGKLEDIKQAITQLGPRDLRKFYRWFEEFQSDEWDRQIERDVLAGKLDKFAEAALEAHRKGLTTPLCDGPPSKKPLDEQK
jgi:hypothetical protein